MDKYTRFEIITKDKMGITLEILDKLYRLNINLISLEVFPEKVYIKIKTLTKDEKELFKCLLFSIDGVNDIKEIELLEHEKNERKLYAVMNSVDEGILYINKDLQVEIFNDYCESIFHYKKRDVLGKNIKDVIQAPSMIEAITSGKEFNNIEVNITTPRGESHYFSSGKTVSDDNNNTIGIVASIRDMKKAIEIANVVSSTNEGAFKEIIGNSPAMKQVKDMISTVAKSNSTVLLRGESGTGKELFARAIQKLSNRKNKKFVAINCAALPDNLIESELFGYEKGSFTGAFNTKEGLFKEANEGTLFLDEVGELSIVMQAKLLRVLQEGAIRKIGSNVEEKVDVRIIAATNRDLEKMIEEGKFREDLYYRLNVIPIFIPPLRERTEDIPSLVSFFIDNLNRKLNKNVSGANLEFINKLIEYNWPGNIRELQNVIERAMNLCNEDILQAEHLIIDMHDRPKSQSSIIREKDDLKLKDVVEISEKEAIIRALKKNKTCRKAAKALGVSHTTIINKINKYNIKIDE